MSTWIKYGFAKNIKFELLRFKKIYKNTTLFLCVLSIDVGTVTSNKAVMYLTYDNYNIFLHETLWA